MKRCYWALLAMIGVSVALADGVGDKPWMNRNLSPEARAVLLLGAMKQDEKLSLVFGYFSSDAPWKHYTAPKEGLVQAAGYVPEVARLGIPAQNETDAGVGVASQGGPQPRLRTALPANIGIAASFDPIVAYAGGAMIGNEAKLSGFDVQLAGGINLAREPRNGRNFEYAGEDPWLSSQIVGAAIRGIQSNHIISTIKHFALNDQETKRTELGVEIDEAAARTSDLLAFELAIEAAHPGAVMCAYNRVNGVYSCENDWLLTQVLKRDWKYPGFVMSDWGAVHSTIPAALAGLDQDSGYPFDASPYFGDSLREAVENGHVPQARLDDMVKRILHSMFSAGLFDEPTPSGNIDFVAHAQVALDAASSSMVLLKNKDNVLPIRADTHSVLLVGSRADVGVLSGGGSSQVYSVGGWFGGAHTDGGAEIFDTSSPLKALQAKLRAQVHYDDGSNLHRVTQLAAGQDLVLVFAKRWDTEGRDSSLSLDGDQDALISALSKANRHVVVVLESGGPVLMPWLSNVAGVLEAWFPGTSGGEAIARILTGEVDPSGHLPITFPKSVDQLPRPLLAGLVLSDSRPSVNYNIEGAAVGYKWFDLQDREPLFPFGFGLSYTNVLMHNLSVYTDHEQVLLHFEVSNQHGRPASTVAQVYVHPPQSQLRVWEAPQRLCAFQKYALKPGESKDATLKVEPRLLAVYEAARRAWVIAEGDYEFVLAENARTPIDRKILHLPQQIINYYPDR